MADNDFMFSEKVGDKQASEPKTDKNGMMFSAPMSPKGEFISDEEHRHLLDNAPNESDLSGGLKNITTGLIKGVGGMPGMFGDIADFGKYLAQRAHSWTSGKTMEQVAKETDPTYAKIAKTIVTLNPTVGRMLLTNSQQARDDLGVTRLMKEYIGEYTPTTGAGRVVAAVSEGLPSMFIPMGPAGAAGRVGRGIMGETVRQIPANIVGTTAGAIAGEATGDPLAALPAGVAGQGATHIATDAAHRASPTVRAGSKQALADREFRDMFVDPEEAARRLNNPPETLPNERLSTGQVTLDPGALIVEQRAANMDDVFRARMSKLTDSQNTARVEALRTLQTGGDPQAVSRLFQQQLENLDATYEASITAAREAAESHAAAIPGGATPEGLGERLREIVAPLRDQARARKNALYRAVDPDNTLHIATGELPAVAEALLQGHPITGTKITLALPELQKAIGLGNVVSFQNLRGLDAAVSDAMKAATMTGAHTDLNLLTQLKTEIKRTMGNAMENQIAFEQAQVARGALAPDATSTARFEQWLRQGVDEYAANRATAAGPGTVGVPGVGATARPTAPGTAGAAGPAAGGAAGNSGVPAPNVTDEHVARLAAANAAHGAYADQYRAGPTGALLRQTGFNNYKTLDSAVPDLVFKAGNTGGETVQHILAGAENTPQAIATMQDIAVMKLRQMMGSADTLTPQVLQRWQNNYAQALAAIDAVSPGFSARFNNAADATTALAAAEQARVQGLRQARMSQAARIAGLESEEALVNHIGGMIDSKSGADQIAAMVRQIGHDPDAMAGMREAGAQWLLNKLGTGAVRDGERVVSSPTAIKLLNERPQALRNMFGDEGMELLRQYEASIMRQQQANTAVATAGSTTGANITKMLQKQLDMRQRAETIGQTGAFALWEGLGSVARGELPKAVALLGGRWIMHKLDGIRQRGIEDVNQMVLAGLANPDVGRAMLNRALTQGDTPAGRSAWNTLYEALARRSMDVGRADEEKRRERTGKARGGSIGIDHSAEADRLIKQAARALRSHSSNTKQLMQVPDDHVTKALAIANEAI